VSQTPDPGPAAGFEQLLDHARPHLRRVLCHFRIPSHDAEDLLQQALLALVHHWDSVRDPEAWLVGTLRKGCLVYWRQQRRRIYDVAEGSVLEWLAAGVPPAQERAELWWDVAKVLARLPSRCRALLYLRYCVGLEPHEVARMLGYRPASIAKLSSRCLAAMSRQVVLARRPTALQRLR
jgi:RNA polymerase sigma-70 factor (ECF subfamily)